MMTATSAARANDDRPVGELRDFDTRLHSYRSIRHSHLPLPREDAPTLRLQEADVVVSIRSESHVADHLVQSRMALVDRTG